MADYKQLRDEALAAFLEPGRCEARRWPLHAGRVGRQPARRRNQDDIAAVTLYERSGFIRYARLPRAFKLGERHLTKDLMVLTLQAE